ncbi:S41 family peptidase [Chitinophaga sp.]|uniref:S41 family peptidase n=1 Tax=Chitinophaga sp. TaxID=1869181 RepID=UPI002FDDA8C0
MFDISPDRTEYWAKILNKKEVSQSATSKTKIKPVKKNNYSDTIISNGQDRIAIMTIQSFSHLRIKKDKPEIENFLSNIKGCNTLIINIHDNGGGSEEYWQNNIVARLIQTPINYLMYPIIKDGEMNRHFYPQYFERGRILQQGYGLQRIPQELLTEKYYIKEEQDTITPNNPVDFQGKIYLLVSEKVFSTSEHFAQFCKTTGWATIAGERTGGDGIGSDPIIVRLPESGILLCYPALIGVNHDGALNFEERTIPDILIDGKNADERLSNLINYIREKK